MAERIRRAFWTFASGVRYITLAPARRPRHARRGPARYWARTRERLARAAREVGDGIAKEA